MKQKYRKNLHSAGESLQNLAPQLPSRPFLLFIQLGLVGLGVRLRLDFRRLRFA